ncbi:MAG: tRNA lysidine(34) synthetase TilS [Planctomycetota bacterium]|jgi:tRNA(Ile)-lysidine synthase
MSAFHPLETKLAAAWPPEAWQEVTTLLAVSGGADSVALMRAMGALSGGGEGRLWVAHFNHHLRGDESAADEVFVVDLCRRFDLPCEVGRAHADQLVADSSDGLEAAARAARYEFLQQTAARLGARYVVTAHTADDQAETILHRIIRGTGIGGLEGMERARALGPAATLIRPLLGIRRAELLAYLDDLGQSYRSDSSNQDTRLTRNRIRHDLLPRLTRQFNPGVVDALLRLGRLAGEAQAVIQAVSEKLFEQCVLCESPQVVQIDAAALADQPRHVIRELLMAAWRKQDWPMQAMGFAQWGQLAEMISACGAVSAQWPPKQTFPGSVLAEPVRGRLLLRRVGH